MARILAISSHVARGHVGLSAMVPIFQVMGHDVTALATVLLSNHPGHPHVSGTRVEPEVMRGMVDALDRNGWLGEFEAVVSGYLPTVAHVDLTRETLERIAARRRDSHGDRAVTFICDPVIGDMPKGLYIAADAAAATRDQLVPLASAITPNAFELAWLSGRSVHTIDAATAAAQALGVRTIVTSVPAGVSRLANVDVPGVDASGDGAHAPTVVATPHHDSVPNGTGDVFTATFAGFLLNQRAGDAPADPAAILNDTTRSVASLVRRSVGRSELDLVGHLPSLHVAREDTAAEAAG